MIVKFDSLNRYETPLFHLCNPGCVMRDGMLTRAVGILSNTSDEELILNFNAKSELNLRVYNVRDEDEEQDCATLAIYRMVANRREIYVEGFGFFVISDVKESYGEYQEYKDVTAYSCEQEIEDKKLPSIQDGTYPLLSNDETEGLLNILVSRLPMWQIGVVDVNTAALYRTFEDVGTDRNVLSFMLDEMQNAYECIFIFDPTNRVINVYDQNNYVVQTDIHFTKDDLITSSEVEEESSSLYTALSVLGNNNTSINAVNPLGSSVIYNFDYYLDWMSSGLSSKVKAWQTLVDESVDDYYTLAVSYADAQDDVLELKYEINDPNGSTAPNDSGYTGRLIALLSYYQQCKDNIVASGSNAEVASYNEQISANGGTTIPVNQTDIDTLKTYISGLIQSTQSEITTARSDYNTAVSTMNSVKAQMDAIQASVDIATYFSQDEYDELSAYIVEGDYTDDYVVITDSMTQSERLEQIYEVYKRGKTTLNNAAYPTQRYTIDVENFLFQSQFKHFSDRLETGCLINVEVGEDDVAALFLSAITVNWYDRSLSLTLGNRFNRFDPKALFDNALGSIQKSANSIDYLKELVSPIANGELTQMQNAIANARNLAKNNALASTNNVITIDDTGYTGRKLLVDGVSVDPRQIKIVNNQIVFTDDAWDTAKTAIGEITIPGPNGTTITTYGINAETLIGDLILGNQLQIGYTGSGGTTQNITSGILASTGSQYYLSTSSDTPTGGSWTSTLPATKPDGTFLWVREVYNYADGTSSYGAPVCADGVPGADGATGPGAILVQIESSNGNIFYRTGLQTMLTCHVYSGRDEITNTLSADRFDWHKMNNDGTEDTSWYENNAHTGSSIYVSDSDVYNRAIFSCTVSVDDDEGQGDTPVIPTDPDEAITAAQIDALFD